MTRREKLLRLCEFDGTVTPIVELDRLYKLAVLLVDENEKLREAHKNITYTDFRDDAHDLANRALAASPLDALLQGEK